MNKRMVFADDGSLSADVAWLWINFHTWPGWHIDVVTVLQPTYENALDLRLRPFEPLHPRELIGSRPDTSIEHLRAFGEPSQILNEIQDVDLLVLGPKGRGFKKDLNLGSVCQALSSKPPAPTLIARHGRFTRQIVVFSDGTGECQAAVKGLVQLPWIGETDVCVVSVDGVGVDARACVEQDASLLRGAGATVTERIVPVDEMQVFRNVPQELLDIAADVQADLIVHGCPKLGVFRSWTQGSIASTLTNRSTASVLVCGCS